MYPNAPTIFSTQMVRIGLILSAVLSFYSIPSYAESYWRELVVTAEHRCTPYDKKSQYPYSQGLEDKIIASMGNRIYGPYTGRYYQTDSVTDIEHIVSTSEAHDSGLCNASPEIKRAFSNDLLNLTIAHEDVNRCGPGGKCGYDAGEWLPEKNRCWFANRVLQIKRKYQLSVDSTEALALENILSECHSFDMFFYPQTETLAPTADLKEEALELYDSDGNGRISCKEARYHGIDPVRQEHIAYGFMRDNDGDGVVCE